MPDASTSAATESIVRANGVDLCYETFGDRANPPVLLIMGLGTQMLGWDDGFCRRLADRGFFVVRFDNRDIGRSTWLDHESVPNVVALLTKAKLGFKPKVAYTLKDMATDAVGLLDALGIDRAHVVGASMGGMIGQEFAMAYPARMRTFTSIMSSTGNPKLPGPTPEAAAVLTAAPSNDESAFLENYPKLLRVLRAGEFPEDEAGDRERAARVWSRGYHPAGTARQFAAIIASGNRTEGLKAIRVPTLVVHGRADPLVPVEAGLATADAIPGAKLVLIDRMGHAFPRSLWDEVIGPIVAHAAAH